MSRKPLQSSVNGYSVGSRTVIDGKQACRLCGQWKTLNEDNYGVRRKEWARNCRPCDSDRVAMIHLRKRIAKHGILSEIASIQQAERDIVGRKERLMRITSGG
jgi:hypothetical protein